MKIVSTRLKEMKRRMALKKYLRVNPLPAPSNQKEELLYMLLNSKTLSRRQILIQSGILNPTARIADLRNLGVIIDCDNIKVKNKFNRSVTYGAWSISNKKKSEELYREMV